MIESGKWSDPAFPRTGWTFWTGKDHGVRARKICEACEAQSVRFAYDLSHAACGLLSVGECCAFRLCPDRADAIAATGRKLRADAEELDGRTVTVEGLGYLTGQASWGLPSRSPLLETGWYTRLTILSRPAPERVTVNRLGCTHVLRLCDHGDDVWLCGAVEYSTDPLNGSASSYGPRCVRGRPAARPGHGGGDAAEGPLFAVQKMPSTEKELNENSANRLYVAWDEYDSSDHRMESAFRSWSTTTRYETRKLFTNFDRARAELARGACLSTNHNPARESATGRRQMTLWVAKRPDDEGYRSPAMDLWVEMDSKLPMLWQEVLADLRMIVMALGAVGPMASPHSMADFATFLLRCARHEGWEAKANRLLLDLKDAQEGAIAEKSFWADMTVKVLERMPELTGLPLKADAWCDHMRQVTNEQDRETLNRINERKFGVYCTKGGRDTMVRRCGMRLHGKSGNALKYSFRIPFEPDDKPGKPVQGDWKGLDEPDGPGQTTKLPGAMALIN